MLTLLFRNRGVARTLTIGNAMRLERANTSTKAIAYRQDLPPAEGYKTFDWERIPQKEGWATPTRFLIYLAITFYGYVFYQLNKKRYRTMHLEMLDAKVALQPLMFAERDRLYLKRVRQNFEEETRLMKNVPGWEVGKWYHEPVFKTVPQNHWIDQSPFEFWSGCDPFEYDIWCHWYFTA
jgi:NADH dehydrogenase (ubiquinone) 1 alpha subcomplex subunit 13